jgi:hypothetical protein
LFCCFSTFWPLLKRVHITMILHRLNGAIVFGAAFVSVLSLAAAAGSRTGRKLSRCQCYKTLFLRHWRQGPIG